MKLSTSTGDFRHYTDTRFDEIRHIGKTKFKYINLEQTAVVTDIYLMTDEWKFYADECARASEDAGVKLVLSHAPCLHKAIPEALKDKSNSEYRANIRAIRNSIEVCHTLGIPNIVVHACTDASFTKEMFYEYNRAFYGEFFDLAEKYGIGILTENWASDATHFSTGRQMRDFIDFIGHPLFFACWDTAHANIAKDAREIGQYENITALGDKLRATHISDNFGDVHHHTWPFAGIISFDEVISALLDIGYMGYFNFEASYTLLHHNNIPYHRKAWEREGKEITRLLDPSVELKERATDLLFDIGKYMLSEYGAFEE